MEASRRLGNLRGRAAALLAYHTSPSSASQSSTTIEDLRELLRHLNRVKRDEVLPRDLEREVHEKEEHADGDGFELEPNDKREMEGLENALGSIGGGTAREDVNVREGELLDQLESNLARIEEGLRASKSA